MSQRGWRRIAPVLVTLVATLGAADSARALTLGPISVPSIVNLTATLTPPALGSTVGGLLTGDTQLLDTVGQVACPLGTQLGQALPNGEILGTLTCALPSLDFQFITRLKTGPNSEIVKTQAALINLPTLIDVNNDLLPDFIATVQVFSLTQFTLRIDRFLTNIGPMPVSIEALIDDPTQALPRHRINAGYDARDSNAPGSWVTTLQLPEDGDDDLTTLNATTTVTGTKGPSITTVAGLFDGTATVRSNPLGGRLRYAPVPGQATVGLSIGHYMEVRAGANSLTNLTADAELVDSPHETRVHAEVDNLPQNITLRNEDLGPDQRKVTYTASAPVPGVRATYTDVTASTINTKVVAKATNLPTAMTLQQTSAKAATFDANNPVGSVEVGYATGGDPILMNVDHPYARVKTTGGDNSFAGRVDALLHASVDATDDIDGELVLGPDGRKPFRALVDVPGYTIDGLISDLPRHTKVHYSANDGVIDYDAFGETIQQIDLTAESDTTFFSRVKRIVGQIKQLPSSAHVVLKDNGSGVKVTSNNPIGQAQALLTSGPSTSLPDGVFGAKVIDKPSQFTAFARVKGLQLVDFTSGPGNKVAGSVKLAAQPLKFEYDTNELDVDASLSTIPTEVNVAFDPDAGVVGYHANGGIGSIDATAIKTTPFFGRVTKIVGHVEDLPNDVDVTYKRASGDGLLFSSTTAIGDASVLLTSGPAATLPDGEYGATVTDTAAEFKAFARVRGLKLVDLAIDANDKIDAEVRLASTPLVLHYVKDGLKVDANTATIPSHMIVSIDSKGGLIHYDANQGIDFIEGHLLADAPLFGQVRKVDARVDRVPPLVDIGFKPANGSGIDFKSTPAVGKIEATMTDGTTSVAPLDTGHTGVRMRSVGNEFALFARIFEVSQAQFTQFGDSFDAHLATGALPDGGGLQDLDLDVTIDDPTDAINTPAHITGFVQDIPSDITLKQTPNNTKYTAQSGVPLVILDATNLPGDEVEGALHELHGRLEGVPTGFNITHNTFTNGVDATGPITKVELEAWDTGPANAPLPADGRNKVLLSTRDDRLHIQARALGLQKVALTDILSTKIETAWGGPGAALDFSMDGGTGAEPLDVDASIDQMPQTSTFEIGTLLGNDIKWDASSPGTDVHFSLGAKDVGADLTFPDLPQNFHACVGTGLLGCDPQSKQIVLVDPCLTCSLTHVLFPNSFTLYTESQDTLTVSNGRVCLPRVNDDDERISDVYQCPSNWQNRVTFSNVQMRTARMEFAAGDSASKDEDGDPIEDDLLKLYVDTDSFGIHTDEIFVRNDDTDSSTRVIAHAPSLKNNVQGAPFFGLFDLTFPPSQEEEPRLNQLNCDGLSVEVDLPLLGLTSVIPGIGEALIGDICAD